MKLLVISSAFPPMRAGEADHVFHLCRRLAERGVEVHVLTTRSNVVKESLPFKVYPLMRDWSWADLPRLAVFLKRCSPDAVFLKYIGWIYDYHPMVTYAATLSKSILPRAPFVTQFANAEGAHPERFSSGSRLGRKFMSRWAGGSNVDYAFGTLLRDSDKVIVLSEHHQTVLARSFPEVEKKSSLIPPPPILPISPENNGATRARKRQELGIKPDEFLLSFFGYILPGKGVETLLRAFALATQRRSDLRLILIGGVIAREYPDQPDYPGDMRALARELNIEGKVDWIGDYDWDSDQASGYLRASDACILPFDQGATLNRSTLAAAAAHGLPILTTSAESMERAFVHEGNVFLCPPQRPEALAEAIEKLLHDATLCER
ncbi:MAG: glycosyltransferase family 4 protein, partial [Nitrososphaeraceae archaeon]